ncbi:MAG: hypothetical protein ACKPAH_07095, partial [Verrucomicrobiota bacterium]
MNLRKSRKPSFLDPWSSLAMIWRLVVATAVLGLVDPMRAHIILVPDPVPDTAKETPKEVPTAPTAPERLVPPAPPADPAQPPT